MKPVSRKRQSLINLGFHYASIALVIVQGIILTPLYLRFISPALYGAWLATGNLLIWITLVDPGLSRIMQQRVAHTFGRKDLEQLSSVIGTGLFLGVIFSSLPLLVLPFGGALAGTLDLSQEEAGQLVHAFTLALLSTCLTMAAYQPSAANLGLQLSTGSGVVYITAGVVGIVATIVLLYAGFALAALAWGFVVRGGIFLAGNMLLLWLWSVRNLDRRPRVTRGELRTYAGLSTFTFVERLGTALVQHSDVYLGAKIVSPGAAAVFSITGRAYEPVRMAAERFGPAFLPGLAHLAGEGNRPRLVEVSDRLLNLVAYIVSVGVACVIALNAGFVSLWVGSHLFGGQALTTWFGVAIVMSVVLGCWSELVFAVGGVGKVEIMRLSEGVAKVGMQVLMVRLWGVIGLPIGACAGILLVSGWYLPRLAARLFNQTTASQFRRWGGHLLRGLAMVALGLAGHAILTQLFSEWTWTRFAAISLIAGLVYGLAGLLVHPMARQEATVVVNRLRQRHLHTAQST